MISTVARYLFPFSLVDTQISAFSMNNELETTLSVGMCLKRCFFLLKLARRREHDVTFPLLRHCFSCRGHWEERFMKSKTAKLTWQPESARTIRELDFHTKHVFACLTLTLRSLLRSKVFLFDGLYNHSWMTAHKTVMVRGEGRLSDMFNRIKLEEFPMSPRGTGKFVDCVDDFSSHDDDS